MPRIAIAFAALWLVRNLLVDIQAIPGASTLATPFNAPLSTSPTAPLDDWQLALKDLDGSLRPDDDVRVRAGDPRVDTSAFLWWSSYWLFPHQAHLEASR